MQDSFQETLFQQWRRAFPWLHLFRVPGIASRFQVLIAGFLSGLLPLIHLYSQNASDATVFNSLKSGGQWEHVTASLKSFFFQPGTFTPVLYQLGKSIGLFSTVRIQANSLLISFILLMNSLFWGLVISRMIASEFTQGKGIRLDHSIRFACNKMTTVFFSLLFPLLLISFLLICISAIFGAAHIPLVGNILTKLFFGFSILLGFFVTILVIGVMFGWPSAVAVISTEDSDSFDAWSRSFDYLRSRLVPVLLAFVLTFIVGIVLYHFLIDLTLFAFQWLGELQKIFTGENHLLLDRESKLFGSEYQIWITFWETLLRGYLTAYFWATVTAIYVIVRHSVDQTPVNEFKN